MAHSAIQQNYFPKTVKESKDENKKKGKNREKAKDNCPLNCGNCRNGTDKRHCKNGAEKRDKPKMVSYNIYYKQNISEYN